MGKNVTAKTSKCNIQVQLQTVFEIFFYQRKIRLKYNGGGERMFLKLQLKKAQEKGMKFHFVPKYSSIILAEISFRLIFMLLLKL